MSTAKWQDIAGSKKFFISLGIMLNRKKDRLYGAHTLFYKKGQPLEKSSLVDTIPRFYKVEPDLYFPNFPGVR